MIVFLIYIFNYIGDLLVIKKYKQKYIKNLIIEIKPIIFFFFYMYFDVNVSCDHCLLQTDMRKIRGFYFLFTLYKYSCSTRTQSWYIYIYIFTYARIIMHIYNWRATGSPLIYLFLSVNGPRWNEYIVTQVGALVIMITVRLLRWWYHISITWINVNRDIK